MPDLDKRILEELIYEKLRLTVDLCELLHFEEDLATSVERALERCARSPAERASLSLAYLERAWKRVVEEVQHEMVAGLDDTDVNPPLRDPSALQA